MTECMCRSLSHSPAFDVAVLAELFRAFSGTADALRQPPHPTHVNTKPNAHPGGISIHTAVGTVFRCPVNSFSSLPTHHQSLSPMARRKASRSGIDMRLLAELETGVRKMLADLPGGGHPALVPDGDSGGLRFAEWTQTGAKEVCMCIQLFTSAQYL